jgi:hypothetical protein
MTNAKTLILAAAAALTLGAGSAMAQSEVPSSGTPYWTLQRQAEALRASEARNLGVVQAGSSDFERGSHIVPFDGNYGDLANPG